MENFNDVNSDSVILHPSSDGVNFWIWREITDEKGKCHTDILLPKVPLSEAEKYVDLNSIQNETAESVLQTCEAA